MPHNQTPETGYACVQNSCQLVVVRDTETACKANQEKDCGTPPAPAPAPAPGTPHPDVACKSYPSDFPKCDLGGGQEGIYGRWSTYNACECLATAQKPALIPCAEHKTGDYMADISWKNGVPSLCQQRSACAGMFIRPEDMDDLATLAASHDHNTSTMALNLLDAIGQRYMAGPGGDNPNECAVWKKDPGAVHDDGNWQVLPKTKVNTYRSQVMNGVQKNYTSTKGCGWWGRGVIQTTGPCNFGKLQQALGKTNKYKDQFNLCKTPELICNSKKFGSLKWIAGFFYWVNNVQAYNKADFNFSTALAAADADTSVPGTGTPAMIPKTIFTPTTTGPFATFVDACSGLVNRGCPHLECPGSGAVHNAPLRLKASQIVRDFTDATQDPVTHPAVPEEDGFNNVIIQPLPKGGLSGTYDFAGFKEAYDFVVEEGFTGDESGKFIGTRANISAFLGQCMQETLQFGACDENNWTQMVAGQGGDPKATNLAVSNEMCRLDGLEGCKTGLCKMENGTCVQNIYGDNGPTGAPAVNYPNTAGCGQLGQDYSTYTCDEGCPVDSLQNRTIVANTHATWWGAPGPLYSDSKDTGKIARNWCAEKRCPT